MLAPERSLPVACPVEERMIFATCGSSPMGFERMMRALEVLPPSQLTVQHGPVAAPPCATGYDFLPFGRVVELMRQADLVVSHAGVGSILCAIQAGHVPIVFPRLKRHNETVDDHQVELARALAQRGTVLVATTRDELCSAVESAPRRAARRTLDGDSLNFAVRAAIRGESGRSLRRRLRSPSAASWPPSQAATSDILTPGAPTR
jgi:UDP-N-acetylglucosamine transferase subunit ALG13